MSAQPIFQPSPRPQQPRQQPNNRKKKKSSKSHKLLALEAITKLSVYGILSVCGLITFGNLLSYNFTQQNKLSHLQTELNKTQARVSKINDEFSRSFDGRSRSSVMLENTYKVAPDQKPIIIVNAEQSQ